VSGDIVFTENQKTRKPENQKTRKPENQKTRKPENQKTGQTDIKFFIAFS
jgi:hypothetical protein